MDFDRFLPAIWLVFGDSYLNFNNAPRAGEESDEREQDLVDLLRIYLKRCKILRFNDELQSKGSNANPIAAVLDLLKVWSEDLNFYYEIRETNKEREKLVKKMVRRLEERVKTFEDFTIIPNGLIRAKHSHNLMKMFDGSHDHTNLAILKRRNTCIDWVQVDPGSTYHQRYQDLADEKCNAYLEITDIDPDNITTDWLYLLVGLKAVPPDGRLNYTEVPLYECLLAHLNGKTNFQSFPDEDFVTYSQSSPAHTWHVVLHSFRYFLRYFFSDDFDIIYRRLLTGFKFFLMEETFAAFKCEDTEFKEQCHFLLQEMCRDVASQSLDHGDEEQKQYAVTLIDVVKSAVKTYCGQLDLQVSQGSQLGTAQVLSLSFTSPRLPTHPHSSTVGSSTNLKVEPGFLKPGYSEDLINYIQKLKSSFIDKLRNSSDLNEIVLLSHGIEVFLISYLGSTDILQTVSFSQFSRDDEKLASTLIEFAEIYHGCQEQIVNSFLSNDTYRPQFFAKNVTIQFFVYAAVAALNYRDKRIGALLASYNLSVTTSELLSLDQIIPHLLMEDAAWLKILLSVKDFFIPEDNKHVLFSHEKFEKCQFTFEISNTADTSDTDVAFAVKLLQSDETVYSNFLSKFRDLEDEKLNLVWQKLAYTDVYLPSLYVLLSKIAYFAKVSLTGFPPNQSSRSPQIHWYLKQTSHTPKGRWGTEIKRFWRSRVSLQIYSRCSISTKPNADKLASYVLLPSALKNEDSYQRLISQKGNKTALMRHSFENEIIASQNMKPHTMDRIRYLHLGFLQSEAQLKLERLYIALKDQQLDFCCEQESVLIKQTLFEVSVLVKKDEQFSSLLEWTVLFNPLLIHKLGLLIVEKARVMQHRLTQHHAIGEILEAVLGLLTFYPLAYKNEFIRELEDIFNLLKTALMQRSSHLSDVSLVHLNAYLIICVQAKPQLLEAETLTILKALLAIQTFKAKGIRLSNHLSLRVRVASFTWYERIENQLRQNPSLLNDLMSDIIPQWNRASLWQKNALGLSFTCGGYAIKPLLGCIYFQNKPITGLPDSIADHRIFKKYLGTVNFTVIPSSYKVAGKEVSCYLTVDHIPQTRFTLLTPGILIIEEWVDGNFQRYISVEELSTDTECQYPNFLFQSANNNGTLTHWLDNDQRILVKNQQRQVLYQWNVTNGFIFSVLHQGYVVPWNQIESSVFKVWIERVEEFGWVEIIAQKSPDDSAIHILSLNFPRLGLHFDHRQGLYHSKQVHGYVLDKNQHINTLHGFQNYIVLTKEGADSHLQPVKVIIPHRVVRPDASIYSKTVKASNDAVLSSTYIVYNLDSKTGLLKSHHIRAQLYLALLYYCSGSLDDHDLSKCNSYHLARENLEASWKDQPFDNFELDIIEHLLSPSVMRDLHSHRVALYLKVVSLLLNSVRLSFLYTDKSAQQSKERTYKLLEKYIEHLPRLFRLYLQFKSSISDRIKLTNEEEEVVVKFCSPLFEAYSQLTFNEEDVSLFTESKKSYKDSYKELFSKKALHKTRFLCIFEEHLRHFDLTYDQKGVDLTSSFKDVLTERFRLNHFLNLYQLAKMPNSSVARFSYLLLYLVIRAKANYDIFPGALVMMLARVLLLVSENPASFPDSPSWFTEGSVDLNKRSITKADMLRCFPVFSWHPSEACHTRDEADKAKREAERADEIENDLIWAAFASNDLDSQGVPRRSLKNSSLSPLECEYVFQFTDVVKRDELRDLYVEAVLSEEMYQFFVRVLKKCDELKRFSSVGQTVAPFTDTPINIMVKAVKKRATKIRESPSLERWAVISQPLVDLNAYFSAKPREALRTDFLFDSQLEEPDSGYQTRLYRELKESWLAFHDELELNYSWRNSKSMGKLKCELQSQLDKSRNQAVEIWSSISMQFQRRPNSQQDAYFALRWYSGKVSHYHKRDLLTLLVEPHKLVCYNPGCLQNQDSIIQELLQYICCEINAAKIGRVLASIEEYEQSKSEEEKLSVLHGLTTCLQENIDPESFRYPHWLLFQFENDIIVRDNQRELIVAMLNQSEKVMYQLNMGEGKSSVILPLLSNNLANGGNLLRVNVLSALLNTMKDFLRKCFSGFIKKRVYTLPFNRDTNISTANLTLILQTLEECQRHQHILLVTPEHRLCLQLKVRELMLENQQQMEATNVFNWKTYRERVRRIEVYHDLSEEDLEKLLAKQNERLRDCLINEKYIDSNDVILKVPPRGQGRKNFARFVEAINDSTFREWSCLKAAHRELLFNSTVARGDSGEKLLILRKISDLKAVDLLDESDEILKHGTELNYTMGDKHAFVGGEFRWQIPQLFIQAIFCNHEIRNVIMTGKVDGFTACNIHHSAHGGVPFIQLLDETYYEDCIKPLLLNVFFLDILPILRKHSTTADTNSLRNYVAGKLTLNEEKKLLSYLADKGALKDKLLIAKGWLSHGILFHVFNAKYRVQYGLNLYTEGHTPKMIAIPFTGKDSPSPRSEFGHPDVMLGLTIISYLYQGLNQQQLKETLLKLRDKYSHQVADIFLKMWTEASRSWIQSQTGVFPPIMLTSLKHLDLSDEQCLQQVHHYLSGNYHAILFYLNQFILIQEAMQYLCKISANAHSLVGYDAALGFSGTDDRKITMPHQIKSSRSTSQEGTNGKLLHVLTEMRNSQYYSIQAEDTRSLLEELSLYVEKSSHCHALIDAGALVTGWSNHEVALFLLDHLPSSFSGVLYFSDEGNCLTVLTRDKKTSSFQDCYLDKQCLFAYLDDIHTRGTDIKLPLDCHAILTIGMGMQKDKLMQAAMRLRQLAQKQSISLWGTRVVTLAIARDNSVDVNTINSFEVIRWVTRNTIHQINTDLFSVAVRKIDFQFLKKAEEWLKDAPTTLNSLMQHCQEKELFSLEEFYGLSPQRQDLADRLHCLAASRMRLFWLEIDEELRNKQLIRTPFYQRVLNQSDKNLFREQLDTICKETAVHLQMGFVRSSLEDDEEKEAEVEIIQEEEGLIKVESRNACEEKEWNVRLTLMKNFIELAEQQNIIMPIEAIKHFVQLPPDLKNIIWHPNIYMTKNFIQSVKSNPTESLDNYLRPADMILIHRLYDETKIVLLSGKEAAAIKSTCYQELDDILLVHLCDIDGPTQWPTSSFVSKEEQKLLTIIKLFSGECNYSPSCEVQRLAKRVGRLYPHFFVCPIVDIDHDSSSKIYGLLIEEGYLDYSGIMTEKIFKVLRSEDFSMLDLPIEYQKHIPYLLQKLSRACANLIIQPFNPLRDSHYILWQWIGTRGRLKEYIGSVLESVIDPDHPIKFSPQSE